PGDLLLQRIDRPGLRVGAVDAGLGQQGGDIGLVLVADIGHGLLAGQVIVAIGHAQAALQQVGGVARRIVQALGDEQAEQAIGVVIGGVERVDVGTKSRAQLLRQRGLVGDGVGAVDLGLHRCQPGLLDRGLVHECGVVVGDATLVAARGRVGSGGVAHQLGSALLGLFEHLQEHAGAGAVGRDFGGVAPAPVGVLLEVVAR